MLKPVLRRIVVWGVLAALGSSCTADPDAAVQVRHAWARATPPGAQVAAVYLAIENTGGTDRLLQVTTAVSERAEIHQTLEQDGLMQMRAVPVLEIPAGGEVVFGPGGLHLMLVGLQQPLREGESLPLTLTFEKSGAIQVEARVAAIGAMEEPRVDAAR